MVACHSITGTVAWIMREYLVPRLRVEGRDVCNLPGRQCSHGRVLSWESGVLVDNVLLSCDN